MNENKTAKLQNLYDRLYKGDLDHGQVWTDELQNLENSSEIFDDKDFILEALKLNLEIIKYVKKELLDDKNFMQASAEINIEVLRYASTRVLELLTTI